jgi:phosphoserine phosphatase
MEAVFFDLDKTIVARSSPLALGRSFMREGLIGRSTLLKSLYAQLVFQLMGADEQKMERLRAEAAKLSAGWEAEKVRRVVTEVLEEVIQPIIYGSFTTTAPPAVSCASCPHRPKKSSRRSRRCFASAGGSRRALP